MCIDTVQCSVAITSGFSDIVAREHLIKPDSPIWGRGSSPYFLNLAPASNFPPLRIISVNFFFFVLGKIAKLSQTEANVKVQFFKVKM